jgi:hypothetical protein
LAVDALATPLDPEIVVLAGELDASRRLEQSTVAVATPGTLPSPAPWLAEPNPPFAHAAETSPNDHPSESPPARLEESMPATEIVPDAGASNTPRDKAWAWPTAATDDDLSLFASAAAPRLSDDPLPVIAPDVVTDEAPLPPGELEPSSATAIDRRPTEMASPPMLAYVPAPPQPPRDQSHRTHDVLMPAPLPPARDHAPAAAAPTAPFAWHEPTELTRALEELYSQSVTRGWARDTSRAVQELSSAMVADAAQVEAILLRLERLAAGARELANRIDDRAASRHLRQTGYALTRRIDIWRQIVEVDDAKTSPHAWRQQDDLAVCLANVEALTIDSAEGRAWRDYLMLDALRAQRASGNVSPDLATALLERFNAQRLTPAQRQFLSSRPVAELERAVRRSTAGPIDLEAILRHVEQYEQTRSSTDARRVAADCEALLLSNAESHHQLARRLEMHYRNANLRLAVSERLLNRMVPQPGPETAPVHDTIQGVPVVGQSWVTSDVALRMLPDPSRVRLALEVNGEVASFTSSNAGPATFYNRGTIVYVARKPLEIDMDGIRLEPSQVNVYGNSRLQNLETEFDGVPLVGPLVNRIAIQQHEQAKPAAEREIRWKIAQRAKKKIDQQAVQQFNAATTKLQDRVFTPLEAMRLEPKLIAAETTDERIAMRVRLAGDDQLGSHTARPQAPADSLASLQVHESVFNNAIARLELDGQTFSLPELQRHIAARLQRFDVVESDPDNEDVMITFAAQDAVNVQLQDGQLVVTLTIARLSKSPRMWRDFQVRAFYKPQVNGRSAELVRDGIIHLIGQRLNTSAQIALRSVFSKTFSRGSTWTLTPEAIVDYPQLQDLSITQFTIDDGWMGVALGPKRTALLRPGLLRR